MIKPMTIKEKTLKERRPYQVILDDCGSKTNLLIQNCFYGHATTLNIPYVIVKRWLPNAIYEPKVGLVAQVSQFELDVFIEQVKSFYALEHTKNFKDLDLYLTETGLTSF